MGGHYLQMDEVRFLLWRLCEIKNDALIMWCSSFVLSHHMTTLSYRVLFLLPRQQTSSAAARANVSRTCEHTPPLALLLHPAVLLARQRVRRLEDKAVDVVALLKVGLLLRRLLLLKVRLDERHLDVGELGVQVFGVYLRESSHLW